MTGLIMSISQMRKLRHRAAEGFPCYCPADGLHHHLCPISAPAGAERREVVSLDDNQTCSDWSGDMRVYADSGIQILPHLVKSWASRSLHVARRLHCYAHSPQRDGCRGQSASPQLCLLSGEATSLLSPTPAEYTVLCEP